MERWWNGAFCSPFLFFFLPLDQMLHLIHANVKICHQNYPIIRSLTFGCLLFRKLLECLQHLWAASCVGIDCCLVHFADGNVSFYSVLKPYGKQYEHNTCNANLLWNLQLKSNCLHCQKYGNGWNFNVWWTFSRFFFFPTFAVCLLYDLHIFAKSCVNFKEHTFLKVAVMCARGKVGLIGAY